MNVELVEIIWLVVAVVGLGVSSLGLRSALVSLRVTNRATDEGIWMVARSAWDRERIRASVHGLFLVVGVLAAFRPPSSSSGPSRAFLIGLLILIEALIVFESARDQQWRIRKMRYFAEHRPTP